MSKEQEVLLALAERVEAAAGPDRELDAAVWQGCDPYYKSKASRASGMWPRGADRVAMEAKWALSAAPAYTASIDAAMTLAPEGWALSLGCWARPKHPYRAWRAGFEDVPEAPFKPSDFRSGRAESYTPALAITAAALRAKAHLISTNSGEGDA